jgi:hypothetical protein
MSFKLNRHLLNNYCLLLVYSLILLEVISICFFRSEVKSPSATNSKQSRSVFDALQPFHYPISCEDLFENNSKEFEHVLEVSLNIDSSILTPDEEYSFPNDQCHQYRSERFDEPFHRADNARNQKFPLAFNILMYENVEQFERLLRLIYRPQNFYCIHVDASAAAGVLRGVESVAHCFDNVFLSSKQETVLYATFSRLQADLNCMADLLKYPSWKYLLNMANSELPLKTNSELVKILSIYRGFNDIEGVWKESNRERTEYVWEKNTATVARHGHHLTMTAKKKSPPPGNLTIVKGSAYGRSPFFSNHFSPSVLGAFSRAFVQFVQTNMVAKEFLEWSRDTYSPDEHYWATLNYNTHLSAPGGYKGTCVDH